MKSKKGFSLVEILAVIVVIGIISVIGVVSYNSINTVVLEQEYENIVLNIEEAAKNYATDTSQIYVTVETLIADGYLSSEDGEIYNPVDNTSLNCYLVEVVYLNGIYVATLTEEISDEVDGVCTANVLYSSNVSISCSVGFESCDDYLSETGWYTDSIVISYEGDLTGDLTYEWTNDDGYSSNETTLVLNPSGVISKKYYLKVTNSEGIIDRHSILVQIDNQNPSVFLVESLDSWSNEDKEITVSASDTGSGLSEYYYIYNNQTYLYENQTFDSGNYVMYAIDNVGNKSEEYNFTIDKIDKVNPQIEEIKNEDGSNKLIISASDDSSGVNGYYLSTSNTCPTTGYSSSINLSNTGSYYLCVIDNAGNTSSKKIEIGTYSYNYNNGVDSLETYYFITGDDSSVKTEFVNSSVSNPEKNNYVFDYWDISGEEASFSTLTSGTKNTFNAIYYYEDTEVSVIKYNEDEMNIVSDIHLIFVIDDSGSMSSYSRTSYVKKAVTEIMNTTTFSDDSRYSVISFTNTASTLLSYSKSESAVVSAMNSLDSYGGTNFSQALAKATTVASGGSSYGFDSTNTFVIFLSDGGSSGYDTYLTSLEKVVNTIYSIGVGSGVTTSTMQDIASETSNYYSYSDSGGADSLIGILSSITEDIAEQDSVTTSYGKYSITGLTIDKSQEYYFTLKINYEDGTSKSIVFTSIDEMLDILIVDNAKLSNYSLDVGLIATKYESNSDISSLSVTYYYND